MPDIPARLLVHRRDRWRADAFTEVIVWEVPRQVPGSEHGYKYRLALIHRGECVLRYDNETGKGDHRHIGSQEEPYEFTSIEKLLEEFAAATRTWLDENPHHR